MGSFQIRGCLYPDFQIPGSSVANLADVASKPLFERYRRRVQPRPYLYVTVVYFDASEVLQTPERDIVLEYFHLHVVPESQQECF